jgi:hypothetical protein
MYNCIPMAHRKIKIQMITHGYQDCLIPDVLCQFIGIVNYYRNMWSRKNEFLASFQLLASHQARS